MNTQVNLPEGGPLMSVGGTGTGAGLASQGAILITPDGRFVIAIAVFAD